MFIQNQARGQANKLAIRTHFPKSLLISIVILTAVAPNVLRTPISLVRRSAIYEANLLNGFWSPNKYYGFLNRFKYEYEKVALDKYTIIEADRTRTVYNWLQYFSPDALKAEFDACGFTIENFYSDVAGSPYDSQSDEFAIVAKRL